MDKFGIFKLLNSFLNFYEQNKTSSNVQPPEQKNEQNATKTNNFSDLLSGIFKNQSTPPATPTPTKKSFAPLQSSMLYTMNSHDEFIKRVKQNNKT
jgi:hypothetical protein